MSAVFYKSHYCCLEHLTISVIHSLWNTKD